jgi:hypothetical protein
MNGFSFGGIGDLLVGQGESPEDAILAQLVSGSGPDAIVGDDIIGDLIVGAARAGNPQALALVKRAKQMQLAKAINPNAVQYKQDSYNRSGELELPIVPVSIAANTTVAVNLAPQVPIQVFRVFVPSEIASFFNFADVRVGKDSQFIAAGEIPCSRYSEVSVGSNVRYDTCSVGQSIILNVRNKTAAIHTFEGSLTGTTVMR